MSIKQVGFSSRIEQEMHPRITQVTFFYALEKAAYRGNDEALKRMLDHPWFDDIDALELHALARVTASRGRHQCLQLLLSSKRSSEFDPHICTIASCAAEKGRIECLRVLMADERFHPLLKKNCHYLIKSAAENGHHHCLELFVSAGWMNQMSPKDVGKMARQSARHGDLGCFQILVGSPQFNEISPQLMGHIFISAVFCGRKDTLKLVFNSGRFHLISKKDLAIALEMGKYVGKEKAVVTAFIESPWFPQMGWKTLGKVVSALAKNGRWVAYFKSYIK